MARLRAAILRRVRCHSSREGWTRGWLFWVALWVAAGAGCNQGTLTGSGQRGDRPPAADGGAIDQGINPLPTDGGPPAMQAFDAGRPPARPVDAGSTEPPPPPPPPPSEPCAAIPGVSYGTLSREGGATDRPPPEHADLNIYMRNWQPTGGTLGIIDVPLSANDDPRAPQLYRMFTDDRTPMFTQNNQVYDWNWGSNSRGGALTDFGSTLTGFQTTPGEVLEVPGGGYDIGGGNEVLVLYAADDTITLKYTREDNVVRGYTLHVVGICVEPSLRALYDDMHRSGRGNLPALRGNQPFGRARGDQVLVAIRDTGRFMDPRIRKDWWIGR